MRLPKLLRKLWLPILAILILILIVTLEERESFVAAGPGRIPRNTAKVPAAPSMEQQAIERDTENARSAARERMAAAATGMARQEEPPNTIRNSTTGSIIPERRSA
jgi:hypothetical protein